MTTHKTICRWCGGEMELLTIAHLNLFPDEYDWYCRSCKIMSRRFSEKPSALAWASQPIPFLRPMSQIENAIESAKVEDWNWNGEDEVCYTTISPYYAAEKVIELITAALAVREEEQK